MPITRWSAAAAPPLVAATSNALKVPGTHDYLRLLMLQLNCAEGFPEAVSEELLQDDGFLQRFHHALLEVSS
jgi:hypothetical protein